MATIQTKSMVVAILLTLFLGPIGLFYASVTGAVLIILFPIVITIFAIGGEIQPDTWVALLMVWWAGQYPISIIWSIISVSEYNSNVRAVNKLIPYVKKVNRVKGPSSLIDAAIITAFIVLIVLVTMHSCSA